MSDFEFIFSLFGLLLGLSLAEVLAGFARAIQARLHDGSTFRIGWLTPLLGAFVLLDLLSFWQAAWFTRSIITVSSTALIAVVAFAGAYYLAASLVFPKSIGDEQDLDDHFFRMRRIVIGVMLGLLVCQLAWYASVPAIAVLLVRPFSVVTTLILVVLMIVALLTRSERWTRYAMLALVARYAILYLL